MASTSTKLTLKLLIDTKHEKVLFAEASKDVPDFLFNLLCLPLSTVIRLLKKNGMVGCLGNLYESVENLNDTYMQPNQHKDLLLKPSPPISPAEFSSLLPANDDRVDDTLLYSCSRHCDYSVTYDNKTPCPHCRNIMNTKVSIVGMKVPENITGGFVKEVVTYMVMDDLVIQPMSTISSITLLNKFDIKEVGALKEMEVELGLTKGVNLLKASLQSKNVLTSVFLKNAGS